MNKLEESYRQVLEELGEDASRDGLKDTPKRAAKAMRFLTKGYKEDPCEVINSALFESSYDEMIIVKDIELYSLCEHHMLPFIGKAHVAYIPKGKVVGLSKVARLVETFARRLQIQERMTTDIADTIMKCTNAKGVAVVIEAKHMCMMMRGVEKQNSVMATSAMRGVFKDDIKTREEFLKLIG